MARPPNYRHDRSERDRTKAAKVEKKAAAKAEAREMRQAGLPTPGGRAGEP